MRKHAEEVLRESEEKYRRVVENANEAIVVIQDGRLRLFNRKTVEITGYPQEELASKPFPEFIHPDDRETVIGRHLRRLKGQDLPPARPFRIVAKDGITKWIEINSVLVSWEGRPATLSFLSDITKRKQAEDELHQAKEAAEAASRAKSAFLANMSHELRTPLNAILGFSEFMARDPNLTSDQRENLGTIGRSGQHLLALINDVLEMSKIEAGRTMLNVGSLDLHLLLDDLEDMFRLRATDKGLELIFDRSPGVPRYIRTDEGKLRQVLINIVGNAVKFTEEGGVTLRVGSSGLPNSRQQILFEVEDTGPGIAPEEMGGLFNPFVQTSSGQKSQEGTGLGLPISRQFISLMGGDISVSSALGRGSIFKFDVKAELADADEVAAKYPARRVIGLEPNQPAYRLLVVEDRDANRKLLVKLLSPLGFDVQEATNGREAIEAWEEWEPHLVFMDMRMPVMDGHEAIRLIKSTTKGQATVVIALTASAFEEDRKIILSEGCDGFIRKPFREAEIFEVLSKHLGVRFLYEEGQGQMPQALQAESEELSPEDLAAIPAEWVADLHRAATRADGDLVLGLIDLIRERDKPIADALASLARDFRFEAIMALTQQGVQKES
jgi:two-component system sensor histidine kinase/response regulator